ncbi:MAG: hypothetical protein BWY83_00618 [bacterium ADurb.Bin478]|nr:MAG: hypothetical protein BWY83_00618 [bacterium ADurb.Bin478]
MVNDNRLDSATPRSPSAASRFSATVNVYVRPFFSAERGVTLITRVESSPNCQSSSFCVGKLKSTGRLTVPSKR